MNEDNKSNSAMIFLIILLLVCICISIIAFIRTTKNNSCKRKNSFCNKKSYTEYGQGIQKGPLDGCCYNINMNKFKKDLSKNYSLDELQKLVKGFLNINGSGFSKPQLIEALDNHISKQNPMCNHEKVFNGNCTKSQFLHEIKNYPTNTPPEVIKFAKSQIKNSVVAQC